MSQLDSMPSLASGMGQRGSLDIDPAMAERYRQSRLQAAAAPIPEESTDLTFSSGMQLKTGEGGAAWWCWRGAKQLPQQTIHLSASKTA